MKLVSLLGIGVVILLYTLYEWPRIDAGLKKEKAAFIALSAIGGVLAALLLYFPELPAHIRLLEILYAPLAKLMESN